MIAHPANKTSAGITFVSEQIETLFRKSKAVNGTSYEERPGRISMIDLPAVQQFLWHSGYLTPQTTVQREKDREDFVPPSILAAVRYPLLHGKGADPGLINLAGDLEFNWFRPLRLGDLINAVSVQTSVTSLMADGQVNSVRVGTSTSYTDKAGTLVAQASGTVTWCDGRSGANDWADRAPRSYSSEEVTRITELALTPRQNGPEGPPVEERTLGAEMPPMLMPPLSLTDILLWDVAVGHQYRAGLDALHDAKVTPNAYTKSQHTGWLRHRSEAHIDYFMSGTRAIPLPFDYAILRVARMSMALTDWIGRRGELERLALRVHRPMFYGDASLYTARVTGRRDFPDMTILELDLSITNWDRLLLSSGEATVRLPPLQEKVTNGG